jgi:hypothetical protein
MEEATRKASLTHSPLRPSPARQLVELNALVAAVGYHEEIVPRSHHPREPDEERRVHAQHCTGTCMHEHPVIDDDDVGCKPAMEELGDISPKCFHIPPVMLPDIISGGFFVSATLCKIYMYVY